MSAILPNDIRTYFCEGQIVSDKTVIIDVANQWHAIHTIPVGDCFGIEFILGSTAAITAFANAGGGQITVTSVGHGLTENDYITVTGTTNYDGIYKITNVTTDTFEITDTFVATDTGTWIHGSHAKISPGKGGNYAYIWSGSFQAETKDDTFTVGLVGNTIVNGRSTLFFDTNTNILSMSGCGIFKDAVGGDHFMVIAKNLTSAGNLVIKTFQIIFYRIP